VREYIYNNNTYIRVGTNLMQKTKTEREGALMDSLRSKDLFIGSLRSHLRALEESAIFYALADYMNALDDPRIPLKGKHALQRQLFILLREYHNERTLDR